MVHKRNKAESKKTEFMKNIRKYAIDYKITEPDQPNHNFLLKVLFARLGRLGRNGLRVIPLV
jgi:hypothetical protein